MVHHSFFPIPLENKPIIARCLTGCELHFSSLWNQLVRKVIHLIFIFCHELSLFLKICDYNLGFPGGSDGKVSDWNAGDLGSIPGLGISPGGRNGNPLQYSCPGNSTNRGAWWATVHGVAKSCTRLRDFTSLHFTSWWIMTFTRKLRKIKRQQWISNFSSRIWRDWR